MNLYSYVITRDYGFAPNPFWNICTLATCKPQIREHALKGDWCFPNKKILRNSPCVPACKQKNIATRLRDTT